MDDIITLIIVIITVVSAVSRIRSKQKPKSGTKPAQGGELGTRLKAFFAEIQRSFEEQAPKVPSGASRWEGLQNAGRAQAPSARSYELSPDDLELEEERPPVAPARKPPVRPAATHPKPDAAPPDQSAHAPCAPEPLAVKGAACPEFLRRAVVWSEILGPPVALRDTPWER
jgi:hypothetical protein